uniref:uncharacterized protein n=1 Tax=Lonchura striata TaxID=40157 RepID=UPI000B4DAFFF|nr:uncharacterized protein LOC110476044 [Lonchura striata domestica]
MAGGREAGGRGAHAIPFHESEWRRGPASPALRPLGAASTGPGRLRLLLGARSAPSRPRGARACGPAGDAAGGGPRCPAKWGPASKCVSRTVVLKRLTHCSGLYPQSWEKAANSETDLRF